MMSDAFIHDLIDWIDNNIEARLDLDTVRARGLF